MKNKKKVIAYINKSISHRNCYFIISSLSDLSLIMKLFLKDLVFDDYFGKKSNKLEFTNLFFC